MNQEHTILIKHIIEELLTKMTVVVFTVEVHEGVAHSEASQSTDERPATVEVDIKASEPQFLIGQGGQTLFDLERMLRIMVNKKMGHDCYIRIDINEYKKKKVEYLKNLAREIADEVSLVKQKKILSPMLPYERRVIHMELAQRSDVATESEGNGFERRVVIVPRQ